MPSHLEVEIARRLGSDPEAVGQTLQAAVDRVRQQVGLYGYARLAGIGTFRQQQGQLTFEPDRTLAEAANHRFAGLEPLQVETPRTSEAGHGYQKTQVLHPKEPSEALPPPAPPVPEADSPEADERAEDPFWEEREEPAPDHPLGPYPHPSFEEADFAVLGEEMPHDDGDDVEESREAYEADAGEEPTIFFNAPPARHEERPDEEPEDDVEADLTFEPDPVTDVPPEPTLRWNETEEAEPEEADPGPPEPTEPYAPPRKPTFERFLAPGEGTERPPQPLRPSGAEPSRAEKDAAPSRPPVPPPPKHQVQHGPNRFQQEHERTRTPLIVTGVVLLLGIVGAVWYFALSGADPVVREEPPLVVEEDTVTAQPLAADSVGLDTATVAAAASPDEPEDVPSTPLRSPDGIDPERGGYTVIVASEASRQAAEAVAARYRDQGYRTGIIVGRSGGSTRYRVGIGQFASLGEADAARTELRGDEIPQDAWVTSI